MRAKTYGYGDCTPLNRDQKIKIKFFADAHNSRNKRPGQHIGPLTRACLSVLNRLLWGCHNAHTGRCFPAYEAIAAGANCARSTVHKSITALEEAGILTWIHRLARSGSRVVRTSNGYRFLPSENRIGTHNQKVKEERKPPRFDRLRPWRTLGGPQAPLRTVAEQIAALNGG